jgi:cytochrome c oxidase cbb3-type subunit 3
MSDDKKPDIDAFTGVETTGHEWDGIKELNNPLPRWWVWTWLATTIWAIGYWIVMPSWPLLTSHLKGTENYSSRQAVLEEVAAIKEKRISFGGKMLDISYDEIREDDTLYDFATRGGRSAFGLHCAQCHGLGATGAEGISNLNDDDWIWGGTIEAIETTIRYGVRSDHLDTHFSQMPAFTPGVMLSSEEISATASYVLSLSNLGEFNQLGKDTYGEQCAFCHGDSGEGIVEVGAPKLNDAIWLYGGTAELVEQQIAVPRHGVMPEWESRLDEMTIKQLSLYVHSLGGGE